MQGRKKVKFLIVSEFFVQVDLTWRSSLAKSTTLEPSIQAFPEGYHYDFAFGGDSIFSTLIVESAANRLPLSCIIRGSSSVRSRWVINTNVYSRRGNIICICLMKEHSISYPISGKVACDLVEGGNLLKQKIGEINRYALEQDLQQAQWPWL
ncbi:hypothetical protein CPB86DRAFT_420528 [Serendipita vermifera]|nr:hypothetical protein CPB86DRAFT_420528 [Serendipita vermifera]